MTTLFDRLRSSAVRAPLVLSIARHQIRQRYVNTIGGLAWSILQPLLMIATLWFVFTVGFKMRVEESSVSYTSYFIVGAAAWFYFSESLAGSVSAVVGNAHLVKKVAFPAEALPLAPIITSAIGHLGLLAVVLAFLLIERHALPWAILQLPYYTLCAMVLSSGLGFLCAALQVFFRDVQKIVEAATMMWFWLTPIVWSVNQLGPAYQYWIALNPAYYIVTGYRDSLIYGIPFWQHAREGAIFWTEAVLLLALGLWVFERLKPEFAELV